MITIALAGEPTVRAWRDERYRYGTPRTPLASQLYLIPDDYALLAALSPREQVRLYRTLLPEILARLGLPQATTAAWSVWLGCHTCRCSPGFRLGVPGKRIWFPVHFSGTPEPPRRHPAYHAVVDQERS